MISGGSKSAKPSGTLVKDNSWKKEPPASESTDMDEHKVTFASYVRASILDAAHDMEIGGVDIDSWSKSGLALFVVSLNFAVFGKI